MSIAEELGVDHEVVLYMKQPPDATTLRTIIDRLQDPPSDLVRRDSTWNKLGLTDDDVATTDQIVAILTAHKALLQRPVVVTDTVAIIGRPKERIRELLEPLAGG